mgnify:CR=1 FL=1
MRRYDPKLGQVSPDGVEDHGALAHQEITGPAQDKNALLPDGLHRHKAHAGAGDRFTDRFCVRRIVLLAFDVRLHIGRWDKPHFMAKSGNLPRPLVRGRAGLYSD